MEPTSDNPWMGIDCLGAMCDELCNNSCLDVCEAGNDREIRVHKVNRQLVIFRE